MERLTKRNCHDFAIPTQGTDAVSMLQAIDHLATIEDILGEEYDLDELKEVVQAKREGRCVVLPCKPSGVTVYQLRNKKHARGIGVSPRHISCATVWDGVHYALHHQGQDDCLGRDFKKTWFLDKAEAQAALRREQE